MSYSPRGRDVVDTPTCYFCKPAAYILTCRECTFQKLPSKLCPYFEIYDHVYPRIGNQINDKVRQLWSRFNSTETHSLYFTTKIVIYDRKKYLDFLDNRAYLNTLITISTFDIGSLFWLKKKQIQSSSHTQSIKVSH